MNCNCHHRKCCNCQSKKHCSSHQSQKNLCHTLGPFIATDPTCFGPKALTGSIIPFSSGTIPSVLVTVAGGVIGTVSAIGFGTSVTGLTLVGNTLTPLAAVLDEAFSVPRAGSITTISASFRATVTIAALAAPATVNATIYRAPAGSNTYTATAASVNLAPTITGVALDQRVFGTSSNFAPIAVAPGDRLLMIFSVTGPAVATLTGVASAGINIE